MTKEQKKDIYIKNTFSAIRKKGLSVPFKVDKATTINDLEKYLQNIEKALRYYENTKIHRLFVGKLERLLKL